MNAVPAPEGTGRHWAAWVGLWALAASALLWGTAAIEAADLLRHPPLVEPDQVVASSTVVRLALGLGIAFPVAFLGAQAAWVRSPVARRAFLLVGALALVVSAWAWAGVPDAGPLWPVVGLSAAVLAVVGLSTGRVDGSGVGSGGGRGGGSGGGRGGGSGGGRVAGVALALAGVLVAVLGWRGLEYQNWQSGLVVTSPMWLALVLGLVLVPLGLLGHRLPDTSWTSAGAVLVTGAVALVTLVPAVWWMVDLGQLQRHEESEPGWWAALLVVVGTGFLAAAVAAWRRWWPLAGLSPALALGLGSAAVLRSDLARFLW